MLAEVSGKRDTEPLCMVSAKVPDCLPGAVFRTVVHHDDLMAVREPFHRRVNLRHDAGKCFLGAVAGKDKGHQLHLIVVAVYGFH